VNQLVVEDESVLLQVSDNYSCISKSNTILHLQLEDLEEEIWGFVYQCSTKEYLITLNENHKGKILRGVYEEALKIINSNLSFIDHKINVITEDNFKSASYI